MGWCVRRAMGCRAACLGRDDCSGRALEIPLPDLAGLPRGTGCHELVEMRRSDRIVSQPLLPSLVVLDPGKDRHHAIIVMLELAEARASVAGGSRVATAFPVDL